ncbi:hypothetical protein [Streptomyces sp. TBY4]|uniref:hypothetical protein n=1 Tax=Streptomyces sp. TBY4 TaxID=2962030 RepID=UPI0020B7DC74|nr:hypothetical protein [Streptomyces sp. TBY4]MCP3755660.1 hypothetical protein [Streptomyces sp. TBY4]
MIRISANEMTGGRLLVYVAHFDITSDEISAKWGEGERFEDEWDLGPRHIYCWRLAGGTYVSLNRVEIESVPGFSFNVRADREDPDSMRAALQSFLEESCISEDRVVEMMF